MAYTGSSLYDKEQFFESYRARRNRETSPNNSIESPILYELLGEVDGKSVLDLGCGDARFGIELLEKGAACYTGIEGSKRMFDEASHLLNGTTASVYHSTLEDWKFTNSKVDIVVSRLVFHYIKDLQPIFQGVYDQLNDNGKFIFSVQHPLCLSTFESSVSSKKRTNWIVDDYFSMGERIERWIDEEVVKYHRTIEEYFRLLKEAGFKITDLREGMPKRENFLQKEEYERRMRIPLFLIVSCEK
ncbi:SAM-dependent methyltransferase [Niallia circulans]|uniref:class I SAM-dependent DNA methyltransferase n=1 Tax=Niallia circulans TaxID=1397 RepID=UPI000BA5D061|nr:class I SAM-dependent methyltransferase [Niallia circulans]PAD27593.1 SAM-dependent methyltransferase [Niallia circulans]PAE13618.1 SAM-dependent methyltransferase [Niallia circulans]